MNRVWPLSKKLLIQVLDDRMSDRFVARLVWERLGYQEQQFKNMPWPAGPETPLYWSQKFPEAPEIISQRAASVHLTRSIPKEHKQSLKTLLKFEGYRIGELYPRKTRRATAVNWLLAWTLEMDLSLPEAGPIPSYLNED
ncbi:MULTISPECIES: DUF1823 family protein [Prochlorococcus]|uniref:DUF1823 family protein n=1 Tax=Prochlorococcus TaxID=1218 RepID=UPI000533979E|nr:MULTISPECIES: DUF1823 family protein [Prochlorococcus]KGG13009.1 hypothetical protein EV05_0683 [Prochlorococcus sp. MIT 0601]